ncbi:uncharacterized protein PRCAT00001806001 [Priceomyces carsonii]|uniref:uncharacterized protein n=1 Tax=Priceomyces carsonii TaxID=28549 RepID=UPI002ED7C7E1|nr:unnamed protein product [Priceomyces carsonii]
MPPISDIKDGPNTISILLTTDNHVGYKENDPIIGDDSWKTFHEITEIAKERDVDMIIQGGDLFHINKPSKKSLFEVIKSLRLNCLGERPCELEMLSDPKIGLSNTLDTVNYEDPNINVSIPVFAISGNHDDATGEGFLLPLDILSMSGLINHFGRIENNEDITVSPLLFQKGTTRFALYGMDNVRDERLHRIFRDGLVKFLRPNIDTDKWFNMLCFHQNHAEHSRTSHIPELFLPQFLNLILWGHEHECIPHPVFNPETGFDVLQAGSSIATSLSEGEVADKHVFILRIQNLSYSMEPIRLKSVRPFLMEEVSLLKTGFFPGEASKADVTEYLANKVEDLVHKSAKNFQESMNISLKPPLPLIRLRVEYSGGYELENATRFSNRFVNKIANVNDVVQFYLRRGREKTLHLEPSRFHDTDIVGDQRKDSDQILQDLIKEFLSQTSLTLIPEQGIMHAVEKFVDNDDKHILDHYIKNEIEKETRMLLELDIGDRDILELSDHNAKNAFKQILTQVKQENNVKDNDPLQTLAPRDITKKRKAPISELVVENSDSDNNDKDWTNEANTEIQSTSRNLRNSGHLLPPPKRNEDVISDLDSLEIISDNEHDHGRTKGHKKKLESKKLESKKLESKKLEPKKPRSKKEPRMNNTKKNKKGGQESLLDSIMTMKGT